ncbi:MAG: ATP-grasp domain-containing protein [Gemmatimonadota bacterium]
MQKRPRTGKVLVLGQGVRSYLAIVRSLGRRGLAVHSAWCPPGCAALRSRYVTRVHDLPLPSVADLWKPALLELVDREAYDLVVPQAERAMRPLQAHAAELRERGDFYLLDDRAFGIAFDKQRSVDLAGSLGIPVPRSVPVHRADELDAAAAELSLPLVLKPLTSFTDDPLAPRRNVIRIERREELREAGRGLLERGPALAQEIVRGRGVGVEMLAQRGVVLFAFQHERVHEPPRGGPSSYRRSVPLRGDLLRASVRLVRALDYTGVLMVEFRVDRARGDWTFMEINGRFWGSLPLAVAAGADFPWFLYRMLVEGVREFPPGYRTGLYSRNLTADLAWFGGNLRADRSDPTLATVSLADLVRETGNVLAGRERSDTFVRDDPRPALAELGATLRRVRRRLSNGLAARLVGSPPLRGRSSRRARRAAASPSRVLFLCLGNICRSPFAERYARSLQPSVRFSSSGLYPVAGRRCPAEAIQAAREIGLDLAGHVSSVVCAEQIAAHDLVLTFDESVHREALRRFPLQRGRLHRFGHLAVGGAVDIADPFGGGIAEYREAYARIARTLDHSFGPVENGPQLSSGVSRRTAHGLLARSEDRDSDAK